MKAISDEEICAALLQHATIKKAAAALGMAPRTLYDRTSTGEFREIYRAARADVVRVAVFELEKRLQSAIETTVAIMEDDGVNAQTRLQAAQCILANASKFSQRLKIDEQMVIQQRESNDFSLW